MCTESSIYRSLTVLGVRLIRRLRRSDCFHGAIVQIGGGDEFDFATLFKNLPRLVRLRACKKVSV